MWVKGLLRALRVELWLAGVALVVVGGVLAYVAGQRAAERRGLAARQVALDSLAASRVERARTEDSVRAWQRTAARLEADRARAIVERDAQAARARAHSTRAESLHTALLAVADTVGPFVPRPLFVAAVAQAEDWRSRYVTVDSALRTTQAEIETAGRWSADLLQAVMDSFQSHLAQDARRDAVVRSGIEAAAARCRWGPFGVVPCASRRQVFVVGVALGVGGAVFGDDLVRAVRR